MCVYFLLCFFFNGTATTEIYTLSYTTLFRSLILPFNAIPNCTNDAMFGIPSLMQNVYAYSNPFYVTTDGIRFSQIVFGVIDRKSTRLNSSHSQISYAVFCLKKKKNTFITHTK